MPRAALALAPSLCDRADTLTESPSGSAWMRLTSVPAPTEEAPAHAPIWEAAGKPVRAATFPALSSHREREIIDAILAPVDPSHGYRVGNDRKEQALRALIAALPVLEAMELQRRLRVGRADDAVAAAFGRLVIERRQRLMGFLGDARRRTA